MRYIITAVVSVIVSMVSMAAMHGSHEQGEVAFAGPAYDVNDPIFELIPPPPQEWIDRFGDNERTRVLHSLSQVRAVSAVLGRRILDMEDD